MRWLASLLLLLVVFTHYGYEPIADMYADRSVAAPALFYVFRGLEGMLLYLIVWSLTPWKPVYMRLAVSTVCAWGALEEFQTAACRMAIGMQTKVKDAPAYTGLCDAVTGWPIYMLTLIIVLSIFAFQQMRKR